MPQQEQPTLAMCRLVHRHIKQRPQSINALCRGTGIKRSLVQRAIWNLIDAGEIERISFSEYRVKPLPLPASAGEELQS